MIDGCSLEISTPHQEKGINSLVLSNFIHQVTKIPNSTTILFVKPSNFLIFSDENFDSVTKNALDFMLWPVLHVYLWIKCGTFYSHVITIGTTGVGCQ